MIYSTIQPCKNRAGYEAIPEKILEIDLYSLKNEIEEKLSDYEIIRKTKVVFILQNTNTGKKLSLFPSGKVLAYKIEKKEEATNLFLKISEIFEDYLDKR